MKLSRWSVLISLLTVGVLLLSACGGGAEPAPAPEPTEPPAPTEAAEPTNTPVPPTATPVPETPTPEPTPTPEGPPPGTEENPLIVAATDISGFGMHGVVCNLLADEGGLTVETQAFASDAELIDYLAGGATPHVIISFPPAYLVAHEQHGYEVAVMGTQLGGRYTYNAQIIAGADTGVTSIADVPGRSVCWGNPDFLAGNKVPRLMLWAAGINPETDLGAQQEMMTQDQVTTAVYNGECEVGTVSEGAIGRLEKQYPDVTDKVVVVAESPPIPSVALSFAPGLSDEVKAGVIEAYRAVLARAGNEGAAALQMAYGWESVDDVEDELFEPLRELIRDAKLEIDALL
jgi:phosphonate transport system substrate-binding protein